MAAADASARASSCQTRSGTSVGQFAGRGHRAHQLHRLRRDLKPSDAKRAMKRAARSTRNGSSANAGADVAQHARFEVARAAERIDQRPSSSWAMALMVKSRRARSCSSVTVGSASTTKPR